MSRKIESHANSHVGQPAHRGLPATGLYKPRWERSGKSAARRRQRRKARKRALLHGFVYEDEEG